MTPDAPKLPSGAFVITKHELYAALALQGLLADFTSLARQFDLNKVETADQPTAFAVLARQMADALLSELERGRGG